jgi:hypothetical protein
MGTKAQDKGRQVGMWSTISEAVQEGWGATARLAAILAVTTSPGTAAAVLTWTYLAGPK